MQPESSAGNQAHDLFAGNSRDLTPAPAGHAARVFYAPVSPDPEVSRLCRSVLSDTELERAGRFAAEEDRARFAQRRAFRRFCGAKALGAPQSSSEIRFETTAKGRPFHSDAPDLRFSFSSCRLGMIGAWSSTHCVGVDIEDQTRIVEAVALARRFFSAAEADVVASLDGSDRLQTFLRLWTLKEAALKSIGEGLPYGLDTFVFELTPDLRVVDAPTDHGGPERFDAHVIEGTDACAALVIRSLL